MKTIYKKLPSKKQSCVATIGVFDGVHLGHKSILNRVKQEAKKRGVISLVITFDTPPKEFIYKEKVRKEPKIKHHFQGCITDFRQKKILMDNLGIDCLWFLKTRKSLLKLSPEEFIDYVLNYFDIQKLIIGEDFRFGHARRADKKQLKKLSRKYGFELLVLKKLKKGKKIISSSIIREFISRGELREAAQLLGRNFSLRGQIVKGRGEGQMLGFPTANVEVFCHVIPPSGVYSGCTILGKKIYLSAVNIGRKPTLTKAKKTTFEAHLINFKENILGREIEVIFFARRRSERKFPSISKLKEAIQKDVNFVTAKYSVPPLKQLQLLVP